MHASAVVAPAVLSGSVGVGLGPVTGVSMYIVVEAVYAVVALSNVHYNIRTYAMFSIIYISQYVHKMFYHHL